MTATIATTAAMTLLYLTALWHRHRKGRPARSDDQGSRYGRAGHAPYSHGNDQELYRWLLDPRNDA